ncbi:MAG: membrane protein insertase YidC [Treponema sp.]|nr:membrane protein insertase YidC [Treponema sp.]
MEKNTIIAIVLSSLVIIGSLIFQTKVMVPKQQAAAKQQRIEQAKKEAEKKAEAEVQQLEEMKTEEVQEFVSASEEENLKEEFITYENDIVKVMFTTKGGDVISYILKNHPDKDTGMGVEMVRNYTDKNRAFTLAFGNYVVNDIFKCTQKDNEIIFTKEIDLNGKKVNLGKRYSFKDGDYLFKIDVAVKSKDGTPVDSEYTIRTSPQIGPEYNKNDKYETRQFLALDKGKKYKKDIKDKTFKLKQTDWAGIAGKYFTMLIKPESSSLVSNKVKVSSGDKVSQAFITRKTITENNVNDVYYIYVGPRQESELIKYNDKNKNEWKITKAKFNEALQTSGILSPIERFLNWCMELIFKLVKNWGVSIIVLTVLLKLVLFPLNKKSSMGTLKMQQIQPKMKELQEKYKDDRQRLSVEMQKLYKEAGYNPMSGCLPMIFQMIILFALYNVFNNYFEFRGALFIKGWIEDLSVGDSILSWKTQIPFISAFTMNQLRLLPFIYTVSQLLNGKISQFANPAASNGQMKFMMYGLPLIFFFLFYNVPSGLLLYWAVSNILQIGQQLVINSIMKKKRAEIALSEKKVNANELKFKSGKKKSR